MVLKVYKWDVAEELKTEEDILLFLDAILAENDATLLAAALGDIARAKGMTNVARETGLGRESLYKSLNAEGNPSFATIQKVMTSLGFKFSVSAI